MTRVLVALALLAAAPLAAQPVTPVTPPERPVPGGVPRGGGPALPRPAEPAARARPAAGLTPSNVVLVSVGATVGAMGLGALLDREPGTGDLGSVVVATGLLVGPSAGNLVQGNVRDALVGTGIRAGGVALGLVVFGSSGDASFEDSVSDATASVLVTLGAYAGGALYDVVSASRHARRVTVAPGLDAPTRTPVGVVRVGL